MYIKVMKVFWVGEKEMRILHTSLSHLTKCNSNELYVGTGHGEDFSKDVSWEIGKTQCTSGRRKQVGRQQRHTPKKKVCIIEVINHRQVTHPVVLYHPRLAGELFKGKKMQWLCVYISMCT